MSIAFATRQPTKDEIQQFRLAISSFCDGSGMLKQEDGSTLPGWRDFERVTASILGGEAPECKEVFDVIIPSTISSNVDYGLSIKSKELSRSTALGDLSDDGRVYIELTNSPAKLWTPIYAKGLNEDDFRGLKNADIIGETILDTIRNWHLETANNHSITKPGRILDSEHSVYLVISYSKPRPHRARQYQLHSFSLAFPSEIEWSYRSAKCLTGMDPEHPGETLFDWYALSGGQLKYYPRANKALYKSEPFELASLPRQISVAEKAARYWPNDWLASGGKVDIALKTFAKELDLQSVLFDQDTAEIIRKAARDMLNLD